MYIVNVYWNEEIETWNECNIVKWNWNRTTINLSQSVKCRMRDNNNNRSETKKKINIKTELNSSKQTLKQLFPNTRMSKSNCNEQHKWNCFDSKNDDNKWHLLNGFELMLFFRFCNKLANASHFFHSFSPRTNRLIKERRKKTHSSNLFSWIDWDWCVFLFSLIRFSPFEIGTILVYLHLFTHLHTVRIWV